MGMKIPTFWCSRTPACLDTSLHLYLCLSVYRSTFSKNQPRGFSREVTKNDSGSEDCLPSVTVPLAYERTLSIPPWRYHRRIPLVVVAWYPLCLQALHTFRRGLVELALVKRGRIARSLSLTLLFFAQGRGFGEQTVGAASHGLEDVAHLRELLSTNENCENHPGHRSLFFVVR